MSTSVACFAAIIVVASKCTTIDSTVATVIEHSADDSSGCASSTRSSTAKFTFFGSIRFAKVSFGIDTFAEC